MKILIVEDEEAKRQQIIEFIMEVGVLAEFFEARSMQGGLKRIMNDDFSIIVLDMSMPTFDRGGEEGGGRPQPYAGREVLRHMKDLGILTPTIVVTQFDIFGAGSSLKTLAELDAELRAEHEEFYYGAVHYNIGYDGWKNELLYLINHITNKMGLA